MNSNYQGPGVYRHYKGGEYIVLGLAVREETFDPGRPNDAVIEVVYKHHPPIEMAPRAGRPSVQLWARELSDFNDEVVITEGGGGYPDQMGPRFEFIGPAPLGPMPREQEDAIAIGVLGDLLSAAEAADDRNAESVLQQALKLFPGQRDAGE